MNKLEFPSPKSIQPMNAGDDDPPTDVLSPCKLK